MWFPFSALCKNREELQALICPQLAGEHTCGGVPFALLCEETNNHPELPAPCCSAAKDFSQVESIITTFSERLPWGGKVTWH